eukprot:TRINITY_DN68875_c0_g1_i1.p1 TRINITY_DN68875_c0_g1~~TRINITY_DN68875_c0_g1_i1.p1  ORF type:complete len:423 (-),score=35.88 TRINITY_DN68875_c0_g1_i1:43-1311(-)
MTRQRTFIQAFHLIRRISRLSLFGVFGSPLLASGYHGPGKWQAQIKPVMNARDGPLGWELGSSTASLQTPLQHQLLREAIDHVIDPLNDFNLAVHEAGKHSCLASFCSIALGQGSCSVDILKEKLLEARAKLMRALSNVNGTFPPSAQAVQPLGLRGPRLGLGTFPTIARTYLRKALRAASSMSDALTFVAAKSGGACTGFLSSVLEFNRQVTSAGLQAAAHWSHLVWLETFWPSEKGLPVIRSQIRFRADLGLHHTDIVKHLLQSLVDRVKKSDASHAAVVVELGTARGETAHELLLHVPNATFVLVDPWTDKVAEKQARDRLAPFASRANLLKTSSLDAAATMPERSVDMIFIDSGLERAQEIVAFVSKLRPGGIFCGHDLRASSIWEEYAHAILSHVPQGSNLWVGPDWTWWFQLPFSD